MNTLISVLGADIIKENGVWRTNDFNVRHSQIKNTPISFRISAASLVLEKQEDAILLLQGGMADAMHPTIASVMQKELIALGVSPERIILEEKSEKTLQQLLELQAIVLKKHPKKVKILSNEWHLPRIEAMVECVPQLVSLLDTIPEYVAAEEVLMRENPKMWGPHLLAARSRHDIQQQIAQEKQGVIQIRNGTYKF